MTDKPFETPAVCKVEDGVVIEVKPDGAEVAMTPEAAVRTADRLIDAAAHAKGEASLSANQGNGDKKPDAG